MPARLFWKLFLPYAALHVAATTVVVLVARTDEGAESALVWLTVLLASGGVLGIAAGLAWRTARRVHNLVAMADAMATENVSQSPGVSSDELGRLAEVLEGTLREVRGRLSAASQTAERLRAVLGSMDEGVIAIGADRTVLMANAAARRMLELTLPTVQGAPLSEVLPDPEIRKAALEVLRQGASQRLTVERNGASDRVFGIQVTPMPGNPCTGVVLVLHDETELRRLESLRQDFVANVSHELKTPLSSIKAYAETLSQGAIHDAENNLRFVSRIEEQADRLHQLILDLLRLARIESGEQTFDIGAISVAKVVEACLADHRDAAEARSIRLVWEQSNPDLLVRADEEGLRQILDNLVDNAIKYTPPGGTVTVVAGREQGVVKLAVHDTGIGIPRHLQPRVFERFFRVDKARSRELGGTGLGLSIVKHLAQSFGGSVSVESERGKGSTFTVELPAAGGGRDKDRPVQSRDAAAPSSASALPT